MFRCAKCGENYEKPLGLCPKCRMWFQIMPVAEGLSQKSDPMPLSDDGGTETEKIPTGIEELDAALDGGWPRASVVLIGGEPGIGKSTLVLQAACAFPEEIGRVLYVTAEETAGKIRGRRARLGLLGKNVVLLCEADAERIFAVAVKMKAALVVLDSVQTISFPGERPGSVESAKELAARFFRLAKATTCIVCMICHVTKDGSLAGPKTLEHYVDVVAEFDADRATDWRAIRTSKNRSGATPRLGLFRMTEKGLVGVGNPSEAMLQTIDPDLSGWALGVATSGSKQWIVQAQAMLGGVVDSPRRTVTGASSRRVAQLVAVLETRCNVKLSGREIFVNVVGGIEEADPGLDLAIAAALLSAKTNACMLQDTCLVGEIGLLGEIIRPDAYEARAQLAERYGFDVMHPPMLADLVALAAEAVDGEIPKDDEEVDDEDDED